MRSAAAIISAFAAFASTAFSRSHSISINLASLAASRCSAASALMSVRFLRAHAHSLSTLAASLCVAYGRRRESHVRRVTVFGIWI